MEAVALSSQWLQPPKKYIKKKKYKKDRAGAALSGTCCSYPISRYVNMAIVLWFAINQLAATRIVQGINGINAQCLPSYLA